MSNNVAELKKLLESANLENKLFRMMANQIPNFSLIIFDTEMKYHIAEGTALEEAGYDSRKMIGASIDEVLSEESVALLKPLYQKTLSGESTEFEVESNSKHYASKFLPIKDENENITHGMIVIFDVTKLKEALVAAEKASEAKTTFIANLSHEIRTPMNGILGSTEILREMLAHNPEVLELLATIENCGKSLQGLLDDILTYAKLEHENDSLECSPTDLSELIEQMYQMFKPAANEKKLSFEREINLDKSKKYAIDQLKTKQVLLNIIGNAIKFTEVGKVKISVNSIATNSSKNQDKIEFKVADSGIGISPDDQEQIFEAFTQVDSSTTKKFGGTGLGLTISRKIINMMAGNINLESKLGKGTTFKFQIESSFTQEITPATQSTENGEISANNRALVAEDNYINQKVIKNHLRKLGFSADIAENGLEALKLLEVSQYSIIFMDCSMPEMDGYVCTQKIKERYGAKAPPIIAVTANSTEENRKRCEEAGMDGFITKPFTKDDLIRSIRKNVSHTNAKIDVAEASFSPHRLLEEYSGESKYMCEILTHVLDFIPNSLMHIEKNIKNDKLDIVYTQTLELKGVLCSIYASKSLNILNKLLEYISSRDLQRYSTFKELKESLKTLQQEVTQFLNKERNINNNNAKPNAL